MRRWPTTLLALAALACGREAPPPAREFDAARAMTRIDAQLAFGPRVPGTPGHAAMAAWLDSLARGAADTVVVQRWTHVTGAGDSLPMANVLARFRPDLTDRVLYVAHWDTRPVADATGGNGAPVPGANDGGSGVAVLLGVMDALAATPPEVGVDLLFVDGEDYGAFVPPLRDVLIGSRYYAANPVASTRPRFAVVWDMVGAANLRLTQEPQSAIAAPDVMEMVWDIAERMGYGHIFVREPGTTIIDDHIPLIESGIRAIDVIGFPYTHWHTEHDTADKLSRESLEAVGNVAVAVIRAAGE
jgi:hypothetical protein